MIFKIWTKYKKLPASVKFLIAVVILFDVFFCLALLQPGPKLEQKNGIQPQTTPAKNENQLYSVVSITDGDTIKVEINGKSEPVRIIGIDSPEIVDPRVPVQCFGKEASDKAKEVLANKKVRLEADPTQGDKDVYSRLLRFVFLSDGTDFGKMMISLGIAHEYTYNSNPYKYQAEYEKAEEDARDAKIGLWADGACKNFVP